MFKQTETHLKSVMLGNGSGSIYSFGCYLVSLVNGLLDFGWKFTPESFNNFLKEKNAWTGPYNNYIDVTNLPSLVPNIFSSFKSITSWPGFDSINWYLARDYVVVAKVDAKGIGGTGSHFVRITDTKNSTMTIIQDPWFGTEEPVVNHYNKYGNILELRVFGVKKNTDKNDPIIMPENTKLAALLKKYSLEVTSEKSLDSRLDELDKRIDEHVGTDWGGSRSSGYLGSARYHIEEYKDQIEELKSEISKEETIKKAKDKTDEDRLITLAKNLDTPYMLSDRERSWNEVLGKSSNYRTIQESRDDFKDKYEREVQARKADYLAYQEELKSLRAEIEKMQNQINTMGSKVNEKIDEGGKIEKKLPKEESEPKLTLWQKILGLLNKD